MVCLLPYPHMPSPPFLPSNAESRSQSFKLLLGRQRSGDLLSIWKRGCDTPEIYVDLRRDLFGPRNPFQASNWLVLGISVCMFICRMACASFWKHKNPPVTHCFHAIEGGMPGCHVLSIYLIDGGAALALRTWIVSNCGLGML